MAQPGKAIDFQYETIFGLGQGLPGASLTADDESKDDTEAYIPLLDVVDDKGGGDIKPEKLADAIEPLAEMGTAINDRGAAGEPSTSGRKDLPWSRSSQQIKSPTLRLHNEVVEFCRFLEPTADEDAARKDALQRITSVVCSMFPSAEVKIFGSYVTGLYLPTSDMDLVVINSKCTDIPRALRAIGNILVEKQMAKNIQVIASATVPIIKFDDTFSGLAFDISFDVANGPKTAKLVTELMQSLPPMRHLVIVLKLFLQQREMNEVYQGGIGSYALLVMVASFLLQHPSRMPTDLDNNPPLEGNIGLLLLDFFRLYGRTLKCDEVAISCRNGGSYFKKRDNQRFLQRGERQCFLAIEDPQDPSNDLAKGSYNIVRVQKAFDFAYRQLSSPINPEDSTLERIIRLDAVLLSRAQGNGKVDVQHHLNGSGHVGHLLGGLNGVAEEQCSPEKELDDDNDELLDRYTMEAEMLTAAVVKRAEKDVQQAERRAFKGRRKRDRQRDRSPRVSSKRVRERELQYGDRERRNATPNRKSRKGGFWD